MTTLEMLLAHYGGVPIIPLEAAAQYWGYEADTLAKKLKMGMSKYRFFASTKARRPRGS